MGKEISFEVRERAEELYVVSGMTFEQVAGVTGVSMSQLKRWGEDGEWGGRKREYRRALSDTRRNTVILRKRLIEKALSSLDPQDVYAIASLESVAAKIRPEADEGAVAVAEPRTVRTRAEAVSALEDAVEARLNAMLTRPGAVSLSAVKDVRGALELVRAMKAEEAGREGAGPGPKEGLSDEAADDIRRRILGLS